MTAEEKERHWKLGNDAAYRAIMLECVGHLDNEPMKKLAIWIAERGDAIRVLRWLCKRFDLPNDWPDDLYLADIIEKYIERGLARVLEEADDEDPGE